MKSRRTYEASPLGIVPRRHERLLVGELLKERVRDARTLPLRFGELERSHPKPAALEVYRGCKRIGGPIEVGVSFGVAGPRTNPGEAGRPAALDARRRQLPGGVREQFDHPIQFLDRAHRTAVGVDDEKVIKWCPLVGSIGGLAGVNVANELGAMTGTLTIRYRRPTPIFEEVRMEAQCTGSEGRRVFAHGEMLACDQVTAEAEGVFVLPQEG